jgi:uncharacterized NAD(P)/FAD-binding protein YdhS
MQQHDYGLTVAIIGGGAGGTLVAIQLLRQASANRHVLIKLVEPKEAIGRGVAYGTREPRHVLNVRAANMSALPDQPEHFTRWLQYQEGFAHLAPGSGDLAGAYAPRPLYGAYLQELFAAAKESAAGSITVERHCDEAVSILPGNGTYRVQLRGGGTFAADSVVLALGNLPPKDPPGLSEAFLASTRYEADPWSPAALMNLQSDEPVLLLGAGLTAVDLSVALHERGHRGTIHVVSRRGRLPRPHRPTQPLSPCVDTSTPLTARLLFRRVRQEVRDHSDQDWRSVINGLRPVTQALWRGLPAGEKRRFLRHLQTFWDLHRHRMAPEIAEIIAGLQSSGQLVVRAGRVLSAKEQHRGADITVRERRTGQELTIPVARIINCTGSSFEVGKVRHALLSQLLDGGLIRPDPLGLGLDVAESGRCIGRSGDITPAVYALGTLCKGTLWETTAIPEIRTQAAELARLLLSESSLRSVTSY